MGALATTGRCRVVLACNGGSARQRGRDFVRLKSARRLETRRDFGNADWTSEAVALHGVHAGGTQKQLLVGRFDAFGSNLHSEATAEADDRVHNGGGVLDDSAVGDGAPLCRELIDWILSGRVTHLGRTRLFRVPACGSCVHPLVLGEESCRRRGHGENPFIKERDDDFR